MCESVSIKLVSDKCLFGINYHKTACFPASNAIHRVLTQNSLLRMPSKQHCYQTRKKNKIRDHCTDHMLACFNSTNVCGEVHYSTIMPDLTPQLS